jgi:hypothetical protein
MNKLTYSIIIVLTLSLGCRWYTYISPTKDATSVLKDKEAKNNKKSKTCQTCK